MAIGYGSEFQLLRYLGHHRQALNQAIIDQLKIESGEIQWVDYPVNLKRDSMDGEHKGVECFKNRIDIDYQKIQEEWKKFWPQSGNSQNWDGIFTIGNKWYFVEAKAHLDEAHQKCQATSQQSIDQITKAFEKASGESVKARKWIKSDCYQLANRLAFIHFCKENNINAEIVYILFINGYRTNSQKNIKDKQKWQELMEEEFNILEPSKELKGKIGIVYIDCEKGKQ